jgi:DNA-binding NtrC family response regulator
MSILAGKRLLVVDDEPDILEVLEQEIKMASPTCTVDRATTYEQAVELLQKNTYDGVVLDIMGVRGFDLLQMTVDKKLRTAMLTAHALNPESLKKSHDMGARAYLPKDKLGEMTPFLEDMFTYDYDSGWKRLLGKLEDYFDAQFERNWNRNRRYIIVEPEDAEKTS